MREWLLIRCQLDNHRLPEHYVQNVSFHPVTLKWFNIFLHELETGLDLVLIQNLLSLVISEEED